MLSPRLLNSCTCLSLLGYPGGDHDGHPPPKHSVSVAAVITDDHGRALLIQRRDNHRWEPPGGVLELGETIQDGLRREVREETGLDVEPDPLTGVYKNMIRGIVALVFRCKITGGTLTTTDETAAYRWATPAEIPRPRRRGLRRSAS